MKQLLLLSGLFLLVLGIPGSAWSKPVNKTTPPSCTAVFLNSGFCAVTKQGTRVLVTASAVGSCTTAGAVTKICEYNGTSWVEAPVISENFITADDVAVMSDKIVLCGQDANSGTVYLGPSTLTYLGSGGEFAIGGTACDLLANATEATADAPITADFPSFKVNGMFCRSSSDATNDQVLTLRSAAAGLTPAITCTIAGTGTATSCSTTTGTTTDIAAGATIAVQSVNTEDLSLQDVWCEVYFSLKSN